MFTSLNIFFSISLGSWNDLFPFNISSSETSVSRLVAHTHILKNSISQSLCFSTKSLEFNILLQPAH